MNIKDLRLISLVGSVYKLIVKVLANQLKQVLGNLVLDSQNAFVKRRKILDSVVTVNEYLNSKMPKGVISLG
jgi:hypothetical protein